MILGKTEYKEYEIDRIVAHLGVRYWDDGTLNNEVDVEGKMPLRNGDMWVLEIDVIDGKLLYWPEGNTASVHYKVCDDGRYIYYSNGAPVHIDYESYVPPYLSIDGDGYGDYVILSINEKGYIKNWNPDDIDVEAER